MAKREEGKSSKDLFEELIVLQEALMQMYEDRDLKGYKSIYKVSDIQALEVEVNALNEKLLAEEYDLSEFKKLRDDQLSIIEENRKKEADLIIQLNRCRRDLRLATLRKNSIDKVINNNEGEGYTTDIEIKKILEDVDMTDLDVDLFCKEFKITNPNISKDNFVLKMFSFFKSNKAFKHYSNDDIAVLFRRNFKVDGKRLSFVAIKELYYANGKTADAYAKLYKIIKTKFQKHIKLHPNDLVF